MSASMNQTLRDLLCIRLRASAALNMQLAAGLLGKGQDELRGHFLRNGELLMEAVTELDMPRFGPDVIIRASEAIRARYARGSVVQLTTVKPSELAQLVLESAGIRVDGVEPIL